MRSPGDAAAQSSLSRNAVAVRSPLAILPTVGELAPRGVGGGICSHSVRKSLAMPTQNNETFCCQRREFSFADAVEAQFLFRSAPACGNRFPTSKEMDAEKHRCSAYGLANRMFGRGRIWRKIIFARRAKCPDAA